MGWEGGSGKQGDDRKVAAGEESAEGKGKVDSTERRGEQLPVKGCAKGKRELRAGWLESA